MIPLHPHTEAAHDCPYCHVRLEVTGWLIPGMRNLADLRCASCGRESYGDLRAGQALYTPMLLEKGTGKVHDAHGVEWFADWLRNSYARRTDAPLPFEVHEYRPLTRRVVLLNCLDTLYGHSLLKLLNAQHHLDRHADVDLVVMLPSFLKWMVPEGVAQVWAVGLSLRSGTEWSEWLAREIHRRVEAFKSVSLSIALSHPRPEDYDIEKFTRVSPFPLEEWEARLGRPTVTYIWRDDRLWQPSQQQPVIARRTKLGRLFGRRDISSDEQHKSSGEQHKPVSELAAALKREWPSLDFAVAGLSQTRSQSFPPWIEDLRRETADEKTERRWCERYAASHLVVGLHGSNMLLPSGHAGSVVELIGAERWGNFTQDILFRRADDCREMFFRYRFLPTSTTPFELARLVSLLLRKREDFRSLMNTRSRRD